MIYIVKLIGSLLIVSGMSWIGFTYSRQLNRRPQQIRQLIYALQILETEMSFNQAPLNQAFLFIHKQLPQPTSELFYELATKLKNNPRNFQMVWQESITSYVESSSLREREREILMQFGQTLGQQSLAEQEKYLLQAKTHLNFALEQSLDDEKKYSKAAKSLGLLIGLFLVLLLF